MKRNMNFIWLMITTFMAMLLFAAKSKGEELPVPLAMKAGIGGCYEEARTSIKAYPGILIVLTDSQRAVFNSQMQRLFGPETTRKYSSATLIVAQVNPVESETLRSWDFSYHTISKKQDGSWCYGGHMSRGANTLNFVIARALKMGYEP